MLNAFDIVIAALAVWRLAYMLKHEAGPWDIFIRIREKLGDGVLGRAMDCIACMSIWIAIMIFIPGAEYVALVLAISALSIFWSHVHEMLSRIAATPFSSGQGDVYRPGSGIQDHRTDDHEGVPVSRIRF